MKLLKFKDFSEVLNHQIFESTPKWVEAAQSAYMSFYPEGRFISPKTGEILRIDTTDNAEDFINRFLSSCGIPSTDYDFGRGNYSGKFLSYELTFNKEHNFFGKKIKAGESYGVVNAVGVNKSGEKAIIGDKDLIPTKLKLDGIVYDVKNKLVTSTITSIKSTIKEQDYQNFVVDLIDAVDKNTKVKYKSKDELSGLKAEPVYVDFDYTQYKDKIDSKSLNNIEKDFGEVLGGIFMMGLVEGTNPVLFPVGNEELVDFYFNEIGISSKAKKGARASATGYINSIKKAKAKTGNIYTDEEKIIVDKILTPIEIGYNEPKNTKYFTKSHSSGIFTGMVRLLNEFMLQSRNSGWSYFVQQTGVNTTSGFNRDSIVDAFILLRDQNKLHRFVSEFIHMTDLSAGSGKDAKYLMPFYAARNEAQSQNALKDILDNEQYDLLVGTILYACSKQLQVVIRENHGKHLSELINNCLSSKQLYLDMIIKQNKLEFTLAAMENSNFDIGTLNGIGSWAIKKISIYMVK